jgi:cytochrome b
MADIGLTAGGLAATPVVSDDRFESREPAGAVMVVTVVTTVVVAPVFGSVDVTEEVVVETEGGAGIRLGTSRPCESPVEALAC